ncbi:MAG: HAD family phosphatase [Alistipes sp.]|nr:HAD family phosphatase [Alistipes sp.]
MKNIVFDLAGVVFARNEQRCPRELMEYFSFINSGEPMPSFWEDYDRGTRAMDSVAECLAEYRHSDFETARRNMASAILYQEEIPATKSLIADLKAAGYRLIVLSNMSKEYIEFLRRKPVYGYFDGEVISCDTGLVKPEAEIYQTLLQRYSLDASQTLFIDDRRENVEAAAEQGIHPFHFNRLNPEQSCRELREMLL